MLRTSPKATHTCIPSDSFGKTSKRRSSEKKERNIKRKRKRKTNCNEKEEAEIYQRPEIYVELGLVSSFRRQFATVFEVTVATAIVYHTRYHFQFSICCRTKRTHKSFKSIEFAHCIIIIIVIVFDRSVLGDQRKISIGKIFKST